MVGQRHFVTVQEPLGQSLGASKVLEEEGCIARVGIVQCEDGEHTCSIHSAAALREKSAQLQWGVRARCEPWEHTARLCELLCTVGRHAIVPNIVGHPIVDDALGIGDRAPLERRGRRGCERVLEAILQCDAAPPQHRTEDRERRAVWRHAVVAVCVQPVWREVCGSRGDVAYPYPGMTP